MLRIKYFVQQSWLLIVAPFFFGLLIAVANAAWQQRITRNEQDKLYGLMRELITDANDFKVAIDKLQITDNRGKTTETDIYEVLDSNEKSIAFAFVADGPGFADKIKLVIAVDDGCERLFGFKVLSSNETPGIGSQIKEDDFGSQFKNIPAVKLELVKTGSAKETECQIVAISGATVSSEAVVKILNTYIDKVKEQLQVKGFIGNAK